MDSVTLGETGVSVSEICLGCYSFGTDAAWKLDEDESAELIERAIELGVDFFDTANSYSTGDSERFLGKVLEEYDRNQFVVGTKVYRLMNSNNPNSGGLSRKAIQQELNASLDRLGLDTVDLYQIHYWDDSLPIAETLRALWDAIRTGKVRYLGASSMWAHQFAESLRTSERFGLEQFVTMQNHYNLAYREEEREMIPLCVRNGVGIIPYSPLGRGFLARPVESFERSDRVDSDEFMDERVETYRLAGGIAINERLQNVAADLGASMAQVALAWLLHKKWVDAPIVGTRNVEHLEEAVEATELSLSSSDIEFLEEPYEPVSVSGHGH